MSILTAEAYTNPNAPLWASVSSVGSPTSVVGTNGTNNPTTQYTLDSGATTTIYDISSAFQKSMYLATLNLNISLQNTNGDTTGSNDLILGVALTATNSLGQSFVSGCNYYYDSTQVNNQDTCVSMQLAFYAWGDGNDSVTVAITGMYDFPSAVWNVTTYSESLQFITPTPTLTATIFYPPE